MPPRPSFGPLPIQGSECTFVNHLPRCRCPQAIFMRSPAKVAIFGGGAGGGKSRTMNMLPLNWRHIPGFRCGNFRIDRPRLTQEGGLWDDSKTIYPFFGAVKNEQALSWTFPAGAVFKYNGLQGDYKLASKDGSQIPLLQFDELQEFTKRAFFYMLTRNRAAVAGVPTFIRGYCNPDPDGAAWLSEFLQWWWDPDTGYAIPERSGIIRWFVYKDNQVYWGDTREELRNAFPDPDIMPISATFVRSLATDNIVLLNNNPDYISNLNNQDEITREVKLKGNFKIRATKGNTFNRSSMPTVEYTPINAQRIRYWDLASIDEIEAESTGKDPDYTVGLRLARCNITQQCFVEDVIRVRLSPGDVERLIMTCAKEDIERFPDILYRIEFEPGAHSKYVEHDYVQKLGAIGVAVEFVRSGKSKTVRAAAVAAQARVRNIMVRKAEWNEPFFGELEAFPRKAKYIHDDQVDALSGAYNEISLIPPPPSDEELRRIAHTIRGGAPAPPHRGRYGR